MKSKFIKWLLKLAHKVIAINIVNYGTPLTPDYLISKGFKLVNGYYVEPHIKDRDRILISFENHYYRVFHGSEKVFITLESTKEWFDLYYLLAHHDNGRYKLSETSKWFKIIK